jgi:hypothetical protein
VSKQELHEAPLKLSDFRDCIAAMPVQYQAFTSKRSTWKQLESHPEIGPAMSTLFSSGAEIRISRGDLLGYATADDLTQFVFATIIWGYPRGMRGFNLQKLITGYTRLLPMLQAARDKGLDDWSSHFSSSRIGGIGLSTYSKFLYFLRAKVHGFSALILDDRLIQVARKRYYAELSSLAQIGGHNAASMYPAYLSCVHREAARLKVPSENLEMFLFEFGLNIKPLVDA